jgi:hypothetical protein
MIKELKHTFEKGLKGENIIVEVDTETGEVRYWFDEEKRWFSTKQLFDMGITFDNWNKFADKDKDAKFLPVWGIVMAFMDVEVETQYPELFVNADTSWRDERRAKIANKESANAEYRTAKPMIVVQAG